MGKSTGVDMLGAPCKQQGKDRRATTKGFGQGQKKGRDRRGDVRSEAMHRPPKSGRRPSATRVRAGATEWLLLTATTLTQGKRIGRKMGADGGGDAGAWAYERGKGKGEGKSITEGSREGNRGEGKFWGEKIINCGGQR